MSSYITLHNPVHLDGEWASSWFDSAHQHFILQKVLTHQNGVLCAEYYTWSFHIDRFQIQNPSRNSFVSQTKSPKPTLLLRDQVNKSAKNIMFCKLSLDSQLLAIQISMNSIIVVDIDNSKRWTVTIKSHDENRILHEGLCWSEHGGGSQDLIIVTMRGLELYKVSTSRNQCKLSRAINQPCYAFWYEPNHRMMLIASASHVSTPTTNNTLLVRTKPDGVLAMHGIFFKSDKASGPKFELPPPEKSPRFDIGPKVSKENIAVVTLYGSLCCIVLYKMDQNQSSSFSQLVVYKITKSSVLKTHILPLNCHTDIVKMSVVDNVLIVHCLDLQKSVMFDIRSPSSNLSNLIGPDGRQEEVTIVQPISMSTQITYSSASPIPEETTISTNHNYLSEAVNLRPSIANGIRSKPANSIISHNARYNVLNSHLHTDESAWEAVRESERDQWHPMPDTLSFASSFAGDLFDASIINNPFDHGELSLYDEKQLDDTQYFGYDDKQWDIFAPGWVWNSETQCLWSVQILISNISSVIHEPKRCITFLLQRGQSFVAPRPVFAEYFTDRPSESKKLLLSKITASLKSHVSLSWLDVLFKVIISPYANEQRRLAWLYRSTNLENFSDSDGTVATGDPLSLESKRKNSQKLAEMRSGGEGESDKSESVSASLGRSEMDIEPLEPTYALHMFLPDILAINYNGKANDRQKSSQENLSEASSNPPTKLSAPSFPLIIRRDENGNLIVTQTETLSYVWLPFICSDDADLNYCSWALSSYIACLRAEHIDVLPALSLLLIHVLAAKRKYLQITRLIQLQFFQDTSEVAMAALELADVIIEIELSDGRSGVGLESRVPISGTDRISIKSAVRGLQQVSLDMLWRLQERATVVRWLLGHGKVMDAISLCLKRKGQWRAGLSPGSIAVVEFFTSAVKSFESTVTTNQFNISIDCLQLEASVDEPAIKIDQSVLNVENSKTKTENVMIMYTIYNFIKEWDKSILIINPTTGKSKLAMQCQFPVDLFSEANQVALKKLFGY